MSPACAFPCLELHNSIYHSKSSQSVIIMIIGITTPSLQLKLEISMMMMPSVMMRDARTTGSVETDSPGSRESKTCYASGVRVMKTS